MEKCSNAVIVPKTSSSRVNSKCKWQEHKPAQFVANVSFVSLFLSHKDSEHIIPKYACPICQVQVSSPSALFQHMKRLHPGVPSETKNLSSYECPTCGAMVRNLTIHMKAHLIKRKSELVKCEICGKFVQQLKPHIDKVHINSRSYPCDQCSEVSKSINALRE